MCFTMMILWAVVAAGRDRAAANRASMLRRRKLKFDDMCLAAEEELKEEKREAHAAEVQAREEAAEAARRAEEDARMDRAWGSYAAKDAAAQRDASWLSATLSRRAEEEEEDDDDDDEPEEATKPALLRSPTPQRPPPPRTRAPRSHGDLEGIDEDGAEPARGATLATFEEAPLMLRLPRMLNRAPGGT